MEASVFDLNEAMAEETAVFCSAGLHFVAHLCTSSNTYIQDITYTGYLYLQCTLRGKF